MECQDIKDATCYGCNEIGHIKTNCPNKTKEPGKAKKTKAGSSQMDAQEAIQDDNVTTGLANGTSETASAMLDGCFISIRDHSFPLPLFPLK